MSAISEGHLPNPYKKILCTSANRARSVHRIEIEIELKLEFYGIELEGIQFQILCLT